jgi:large subunit ribosomal protein L11
MVRRIIRLSVTPGKLSQNPTLTQSLQPHGIDPSRAIEEINRRTKILSNYGIGSLFVEIELDEAGRFEIKLELPPVTELILRSIGKETGAHQAGKEVVGDVDMEKLAEITYIKWEELRSSNFRAALKQVISACRSIGVTIEGRDPREIIRELSSGKYDEVVRKYEEILRNEGRLQ